MKYLIAGYGKFGRLALERITVAFPRSEIIIVEQNPDRLPQDASAGISTFSGDAASFMLNSSLLERGDWIVPMVPFHLAAEYLAKKSPSLKPIPFPLGVSLLVPNPYPGGTSDLCCSVSDFLCPDNCPEGICCTVTGQPRSPLYEALEGLKIPDFQVLVLRSSQILPGVGGYKLNDLAQLEKRLSSGKYIIATSCKCHAAMTSCEIG